MAVMEVRSDTLVDITRGLTQDGNLVHISEVLQKECPILKDAPFIESNFSTFHKAMRRKTLPRLDVKKINKGVGGSFGESEEVDFGLKLYMGYPRVDRKLEDLMADKARYLQQQIDGEMMGAAQQLEGDFIYDNIASNGKESIDGLASYANKIAGGRVIDAEGTGANLASIYVVAWDQTSGVCGAYAKGTNGGLKFEDKGYSLLPDPDDVSKLIEYHVFDCSAQLGLVVNDPRAIARVANIDLTDVDATTFNEEWLMEAISIIPASLRSKAVIYAPNKVLLAMQKRGNAKGNASYPRENLYGEWVTMFNTTPVRVAEMISEHETAVA
jgi:hypothetical protein